MENHINNFVLDRNKEQLTNNELVYLDTLSDDEIKNIIKYCENQYNFNNAIQTGLKLIMNQMYGAFGNEYFVCSTGDIAGAITAMGRDVVKYMDIINEDYWYNYWHLDTELHEYLGIDTANISKIDDSWIHRESKTTYTGVVNQIDIEEGIYQRKCPVSTYIDTDSVFVGFEEVMRSIKNFNLNKQEFVNKVCKYRLEKLFKNKLKKYAKKYNVDNLQDFELENINESIIFLTKKKYIKHTIWEDGAQYDRLTNITPKGVNLIQRGTPKFAREKVLQIINYLFDNADTYNIKDLLKFVRDIKKEFELTDIDDIVQSTNINSYWSNKLLIDGKLIDSPGIIEDKDKLLWGKGTYYTIKAAGLYNHLLYQHPELINTYEFIKPGTKVKIYPTTNELNNKFCYIYGKFPKEFAPPIDYDELFQKTVINQVNDYLICLNLPELNKRLKIVMSLF